MSISKHKTSFLLPGQLTNSYIMASGGYQWGDKVDKGKWDKGGQQEWKKGRTVETVWGASTFGLAREESSTNFGNKRTENDTKSTFTQTWRANIKTGTGEGIATTSRSSGSWEEALLKSVQK